MIRSHRFGLTAVFCLLLTSLTSASTADLAGTWVAPIQDGARTFTVVFEVKGDTFTGTVALDSHESQPITDGKIDGNKITFKAGPPNDLAYFTGTVAGDDLKLDLADPKGEHQFSMTATRKRSGK